MKYKDYSGHVEYNDEAKIFHGEVLGIKAVVTFQGTMVEEIEQNLWLKRVSYTLEKVISIARVDKSDIPISGRFNQKSFFLII